MLVDVLCAGIVVADHVCTPVPHLPAAGELVLADRMTLTIGGCAANVAADLSRMGVPAAVVGRVGRDDFGRVVADLLKASGVDISGLGNSSQADTSQTMIVNVQGDDRRFIHAFGANADFHTADIPAQRVRSCKVLYLGGYFVLPGVTQEELLPVFRSAREHGVRTVLDVVTPAADDYLPRLAKLMPHVDVFLPNQQEASLITAKHDPISQAGVFQRLGATTTIIRRG
jgi:sugar/nucleoside kinase (ribokinase family)